MMVIIEYKLYYNGKSFLSKQNTPIMKVTRPIPNKIKKFQINEIPPDKIVVVSNKVIIER